LIAILPWRRGMVLGAPKELRNQCRRAPGHLLDRSG
jgi:hypothetical protein